MKIPVKTIIKVDSADARRLYYQGHTICTSSDGHTTQGENQKDSSPVAEDFFKQDIIFGLVLSEEETKDLKTFQKHSLVQMILAFGFMMVSINSLLYYGLTQSIISVVLFLITSYVSINRLVYFYELSKKPGNKYLMLLDKYNIKLNSD